VFPEAEGKKGDWSFRNIMYQKICGEKEGGVTVKTARIRR
jgi:hypothetical protein